MIADYGYTQFYKSVDTTMMGRLTYDKFLHSDLTIIMKLNSVHRISWKEGRSLSTCWVDHKHKRVNQ